MHKKREACELARTNARQMNFIITTTTTTKFEKLQNSSITVIKERNNKGSIMIMIIV